jgi:hypothetical protein
MRSLVGRSPSGLALLAPLFALAQTPPNAAGVGGGALTHVTVIDGTGCVYRQ